MQKQVAMACLQQIQARTAGKAVICDLCGGSRWNGDALHNLPGANAPSASLVLGGESYSYIALSCVICGNTKLINVVLLLGRPAFESIMRDIQTQIGTKILKKAAQPEAQPTGDQAKDQGR